MLLMRRWSADAEWSKAVALFTEAAEENRDQLLQIMDPQQRRDAQRLAKEYAKRYSPKR